MKHVAIFLPTLHGGGAERVMLTLSQGFAERGVSTDLVLAKAEGPYIKHVSNLVRVVDLNASRVLFSLPRLVWYLHQTRPHAMLTALEHANLVAIIARNMAKVETRLVISVRGTPSCVDALTQSLRVRIIPSLARMLYPSADSVVAVSHGVAEDVKRFYRLPASHVRVVYNPVMVGDILNKAQQPIGHPWLQGEMPPVILAVGRLSEEKDFVTLLRAFVHVRKMVDARLVILGEGRQRQMLERLITELNLKGYVDLPGFVENPYAYMRRAAVFVLSSRHEGLSNVLIEALACGTPVVATDCPSGPREILEDGKWGKLVPVGNPEALAEAIVETLQSPPSPQGLQRRASEFSVEASVEQYLQVLGIKCEPATY